MSLLLLSRRKIGKGCRELDTKQRGQVVGSQGEQAVADGSPSAGQSLGSCACPHLFGQRGRQRSGLSLPALLPARAAEHSSALPQPHSGKTGLGTSLHSLRLRCRVRRCR